MIHLRKCQACQNIKNRDEMIKITILEDGKIVVNSTSSQMGRSMYLCKNKECVKNAIKKKRIYKALKTKNFKQVQEIETYLLNCYTKTPE